MIYKKYINLNIFDKGWEKIIIFFVLKTTNELLKSII